MSGAEARGRELLGGRYQLERPLASGGMGVVFAATHVATGRQVAVKRLKPDLAQEPELILRATAEARLAVEAAHPNVVQVLDADQDEQGSPFVVFERLQGDTLEAWLDQPLALQATAHVLVPIINALAAMHARGVIHRDVKPANIFLHTAAGLVMPKILDFGIAKNFQAEGMTLAGSVLGTPAYMAPEQALGTDRVGFETDVWAVAVVLMRCLTGRLPFETNPRRGRLQVSLGECDVSALPAPLAPVLLKALRFDPGERYPSLVEFRQDFLNSLKSVDPEANWPGEGTTAFDAAACALPPCRRADADSVQGRASALPEGASVPARHESTRTLAPVGATRAGRLPSASLGLAGVLVVALGAGYWRLVEQRAGSVRLTEASAPLQPQAAAPAAPGVAVGPATVASPQSDRPVMAAERQAEAERAAPREPSAPAAAPGKRQRASRAALVPQRGRTAGSPSRANVAAPAAVAPGALTPPASPGAPVAPTVGVGAEQPTSPAANAQRGANRSPILE